MVERLEPIGVAAHQVFLFAVVLPGEEAPFFFLDALPAAVARSMAVLSR